VLIARLPQTNKLLRRIGLKKYRDTLILGGVIGILTFILLWKLFG
jgi:hypothetical protein